MKTRKLETGRSVSVHHNDGLRKRCDCARRAWAKCSHSWHFSFKWKETHHRFPLDKYATVPIASKDAARTEADRLRILIRGGQFPPATTAPATPADLTFEQFTTKWREHGRADASDSLKANDLAICTRLGNLLASNSNSDTKSDANSDTKSDAESDAKSDADDLHRQWHCNQRTLWRSGCPPAGQHVI